MTDHCILGKQKMRNADAGFAVDYHLSCHMRVYLSNELMKISFGEKILSLKSLLFIELCSYHETHRRKFFCF